MTIANKTLRELLPLSYETTPAVSIRQENKIWVATGMLIHYLESFTDSLVVTGEKEEPLGVIGGRELIENFLENPTTEFFDQTDVEIITDKNLVILTENTTLGELLNKWNQTHRAFSITPNKFGGYSAISGRKLLEIGVNCITDLTLSDFPKKNIVTFDKTNTIKEIIGLMLKNNTRKILLKDSNYFISDRLIIESIAKDFNFFRDTTFLERKFEESFKLAEAIKISKDINLSELSKIMFIMPHPCVIYKDQVFTPWDICKILESPRIEFLG